MYCGIDFGSSNSAVGVFKDNKISFVPLEDDGSVLLPSTIYFAQEDLQIAEISESEVARLVAEEKRNQNRADNTSKKLSDAQIENQVRSLLRREAFARAETLAQTQNATDLMKRTQQRFYGKTAIEYHMEYPLSGSFIKSPKVFLGSDITSSQLAFFESIVGDVFKHILHKTEKYSGQKVSQAVIGRPIKYHGNRGEAGNKQAMEIMQKAAKTAGLSDIVFMFEPLAAALSYENQLQHDETILVIDIGGGTTDCSVVNVGPSFRQNLHRENDLLAYAGDRIGGIDIDVSLGWSEIMPHLGKDTKELHLKAYDAISINDIPRQQAFYKTFSVPVRNEDRDVIFNRLYKVYKEQLTYRLAHSAEQAKIELSQHERITLPLGYVEDALNIEISRLALQESIEICLNKITKIIKEAINASSSKIETVYITGGSANSPVVQNAIKSVLGKDIALKSGNMFESVTAGLATYAKTYFGS